MSTTLKVASTLAAAVVVAAPVAVAVSGAASAAPSTATRAERVDPGTRGAWTTTKVKKKRAQFGTGWSTTVVQKRGADRRVVLTGTAKRLNRAWITVTCNGGYSKTTATKRAVLTTAAVPRGKACTAQTTVQWKRPVWAYDEATTTVRV